MHEYLWYLLSVVYKFEMNNISHQADIYRCQVVYSDKLLPLCMAAYNFAHLTY